MFSISAILHPYGNNKGLHKVNIQVIYKRMKVYIPTPVKVKIDQFKDGAVVKADLQKRYNALLQEQKNEIEKRLLDAIRKTDRISKDSLKGICKGSTQKNAIIENFIAELTTQLKGKLSDGRLAHYHVMSNKLTDYQEGVSFYDIDVPWLQKFEAWIRSKDLAGNTIVSNMSLLKSVLNKAAVAELIDERQFRNYKVPTYKQPIPEYLTETEMSKFFDFVKNIEKATHKLAGYYFYLSCNTGFRIGDAKTFDYEKRIIDESYIILRTRKNDEIVSIPIHKQLREVLDFVKDKPLIIPEPKVREYVKEICSLIGIKKHIKYHCSRHTWAMLLTAKGLKVEEVAETLGDSVDVARIYARIVNPHLHQKIRDVLG